MASYFKEEPPIFAIFRRLWFRPLGSASNKIYSKHLMYALSPCKWLVDNFLKFHLKFTGRTMNSNAMLQFSIDANIEIHRIIDSQKWNETEQSVNHGSITNSFAQDYISFVIIRRLSHKIIHWSFIFKMLALILARGFHIRSK